MLDHGVDSILRDSKGNSSFQNATAKRPHRKGVEVLTHDMLCANKRNRKELLTSSIVQEKSIF